MFRIRIRIICKLLSLQDPDPLGRGTDPDPPVSKKTLNFYCFVTYVNYVNVPSKSNKHLEGH
jgi:hypothetical protein